MNNNNNNNNNDSVPEFIEKRMRKVSRRVRLTRLIVISTLLLVSTTGGIVGLYYITQYTNRHFFKWQSPIKFQRPLLIEKRAVSHHGIINTAQATMATNTMATNTMATSISNSIESKITATFGKDAKVAIAVAKAESGLNCNAVNHNKNGSKDFSLFQINEVHRAKYAGRNIMDCDVNLDVAYQIYKAQGWTPWVAYKNGAYKKYLD